MKKTIVSLVSCLAAFLALAGNDSEPHPNEALSIDVPSGETWTYSGTISGTSSITKSGLGTLVLSNEENDFTGGLTINAGTVEVTKEGALGADENPVQINYTSDQLSGLLFFNAGTATFNQPITFAYPNAEVKPTNMKFAGVVTLGGTITYSSGTSKCCGYIVSAGTESATVTFLGDMKRTKVCYPLMPYPFKGTIHYKGKMLGGNGTSQRFDFGKGGTTWYLYSSGNVLGNVQANAAKQYVHCAGKNVINTTLWMNKNGAIHLDGNDQTVVAISGNGGAASYTGSETLSEPYITTTDPATLTVSTGISASTAANVSRFGYMQLDGPITLVVNLTDSANLQPLTNRWHSMSGDLIVSNGTCYVMRNSKFAHVPRIEVAGGTLKVDTQIADAFASVTNLTIQSGATFDLAEVSGNPFDAEKAVLWLDYGATASIAGAITVRELHYRDAAEGQWKKLRAAVHSCDGSVIAGLVGGGTLTIQASEANVASSWTGGGQTTDASDAANWSESGDLAEAGALSPTFATAGTEAVIPGPFGFYNIFFDAPNDFILRKGSESAAISFFGNTITSAKAEIEEGESARIYEIEPPLTYASQLEDYADFVVSAGSNTVVKLHDITSLVDFKLIGQGAVELSGTNVFSGQIQEMDSKSVRGDEAVFANHRTKLTVRGFVQAPGYETESATSEEGPHVFRIGAVGSLPADFPEVTTFAGADVRMPVFVYGRSSGRVTADFAANTSNRFYNVCVGGQNGSARLGDGAVVNIEGQLYVKPDFGFSGTAPNSVVYLNGVYTRAKFIYSSGTIVFRKTGGYGSVYSEKTGGVTLNADTSVLRFEADEAWTNGKIQMNKSGKIQLGTTKQSFEDIIIGNSGVDGEITGDYPARIRIRPDQYDDGLETTTISCNVTGGVGFTMDAAGETLLLKGKAFASCGDLCATNGTLELAADASWLNGTNFTARGEGVLKFAKPRQIDKTIARLHFAENGKVYIPAGMTLRVAAADVLQAGDDEPTPVEAGAYTGASGALAGRIAGGGRVQVGPTGIVLIVR